MALTKAHNRMIEGAAVNVKDFGAVGDGVTDDTAAIQAAITAGCTANTSVYFPAGQYVYSDEIDVTDTVHIYGAGERCTFFKPASSYSGWFMKINDCWRANAEKIDKQTIDLSIYRAGVELSEFSVLGDRSVNPASSSHGIRTFIRCDALRMRNVNLLYLTGTGLSLGAEGNATNYGLIRESTFENVIIRQCGDVSTDAFILDSPQSSGDASNQLTFNDCQFVYNYGTVRLRGSSSTRKIRRIHFHSFMCHGLHTDSTATAIDLLTIEGNIEGVEFYGLKANGSHEVSSVKYGAVRIKANSSGDVPTGILINGDVRTCNGHGYMIDEVGFCNIQGYAETASINGDELVVGANAITADRELEYSVLAQGTGRTFNIDSTVKNVVNHNWARTSDTPMRFESGNLVLGWGGTGSAANTPAIYFGTDATPEATITAARSSLYFKVDGDDNERLFIKKAGTGNTDWAPVPYFVSKTQAQLRNAASSINTTGKYVGKQVWDSTNNKPVYAGGTGATDVWYDATGTTAHTPS